MFLMRLVAQNQCQTPQIYCAVIKNSTMNFLYFNFSCYFSLLSVEILRNKRYGRVTIRFASCVVIVFPEAGRLADDDRVYICTFLRLPHGDRMVQK